MAVGVERQRELVVRPLDLLRARVLRQAQNCVGLLDSPRREATAAQQRWPWKSEERPESVRKSWRKLAVCSAKLTVGFEPRLCNGGRHEWAASRPVANTLRMARRGRGPTACPLNATPFEASPGAMGMALDGGDVNAGNVVYCLPAGLYSTTPDNCTVFPGTLSEYPPLS